MIEDIAGQIIQLLNSVPAARVIIAGTMMFFLPGFAWTLVLFNNRQINLPERFALSVGISITIVTLAILALNMVFNISITGTNSALAISAITIIPLAWYFLKRNFLRKKNDSI